VTTRRRDEGFSVAELLVALSIMGIIMVVMFMATQVVDVGGKVTRKQSAFTRDISSPLHVMDKRLSQNKAIENNATYISNAYQITSRGPLNPTTKKYRRHVYAVDSLGRLVETTYEVAWGAAPVKVNEYTWTDRNANLRLAKGPVFTYLDASGVTTVPAGARSVLIELWSEVDGDYMVGRRQVFFRNR
jgi:prepilin-type N-terminal cleavage/methylation domain-containing protein